MTKKQQETRSKRAWDTWEGKEKKENKRHEKIMNKLLQEYCKNK